jgi:hypothetical protein
VGAAECLTFPATNAMSVTGPEWSLKVTKQKPEDVFHSFTCTHNVPGAVVTDDASSHRRPSHQGESPFHRRHP